MVRASVLIPTHEHTATLPLAVASVQAQRLNDIEILIVGDGVDDELRSVIRQLQSDDARIRFFDLPKAPGHGELNRDPVLRQAKGRIVCYHADDDLWLPGHLEAIEFALEQADFVGAMQVNVEPNGRISCYFFDFDRMEFVKPWLEWQGDRLGEWVCQGFGLTFTGHRLDAYRRLPEGWTTAPAGYPSDQVMWKKFMSQPWCRGRFLNWPISLHFSAVDRRHWTAQQRADELRRWTQIIASPDGAAHLSREILTGLGHRLYQEGLRTKKDRADVERALASEKAIIVAELKREKAVRAGIAAELEATAAELEATAAELEATAAELEATAAELEATAAELKHERNLRQQLAAERDAMINSTSWRLTAPMREAQNWLRRRPGV